MKQVYNQDTLPDINLPARCFTCNKVVGNMEFKWLNELKNLQNVNEHNHIEEDKCSKNNKKHKNLIIMERLGLNQCCRSIVMAHMMYVLKDKF